MTKFKKQSQLCREQGEKDFLAGKPITAFYEMAMMPGERHKEQYRGAYQIGWRLAKEAQQQKGN